MRALIKVMLVLALVFASTFLIAKTTGFLSTENIENLLNAAQTVSPSYIFAVVALLLFADLFIAVPTLTIILLAGFFLGPAGGFSAAVTGLYCAGICGYLISRRYGNILLGAIVKDTAQQQEARESFQSHGFLTILLSRALPILPEVSACMAGLTRMPFFKFLTAWSISTLPYALIAAYAGSISSVENPQPAILTAIGLTSFFWISWLIFKKFRLAKNA